MPLSTFILIPGAWHAATCWQRVVPLLQAHGHRVIAPDLRGMGSDHTPLAEVTLVTWVDQIVSLIQEQETPVILVGHSRGGIIISEVAQQVPEKIKLLVYLSAYLLPSGESMVGIKSRAETEAFFIVQPDGTYIIKPDKIATVLYNTTSSEWLEHVPSMLSPEPTIISVTPLQLTDDRFGRVPRAYIECTEDKALPSELQRHMRSQLPCKYVIQMNTDHSPFLSAPAELAARLLELAAKE